MLNFNLNGKEVSLLTNFDEITKDFLKTAANEITVSPDRSLIALINISTPVNLIYGSSSNKKNNPTVRVIPVFVKTGGSDTDFINSIKCKEKLVISRSNIELADHVHLDGNKYSLAKVVNLLTIDDVTRQKFVKSQICPANTPVYAVEFKIVNNVDIHGVYHDIEDINVNPA